jgi:hypothetical protein
MATNSAETCANASWQESVVGAWRLPCRLKRAINPCRIPPFIFSVFMFVFIIIFRIRSTLRMTLRGLEAINVFFPGWTLTHYGISQIRMFMG